MRIIAVHWKDSCNTQGWVDEDEFGKKINVCEIVSVGFEITSDKDQIKLALGYDEKNKNCCQVQAIPRECVTKIDVLRESLMEKAND